MPEDFSEVSNKSIWKLLDDLVAIAKELEKELPFDYLIPQWHIEDATDNFMLGITGKWGDSLHSLTVHTHYLDSPPEPKEMYPPGCCAVGSLQISVSKPHAADSLEICGTPKQWLVHHHGKWIPLSASYVAFLMGMNQKPPSSLQDGQP